MQEIANDEFEQKVSVRGRKRGKGIYQCATGVKSMYTFTVYSWRVQGNAGVCFLSQVLTT